MRKPQEPELRKALLPPARYLYPPRQSNEPGGTNLHPRLVYLTCSCEHGGRLFKQALFSRVPLSLSPKRRRPSQSLGAAGGGKHLRQDIVILPPLV